MSNKTGPSIALTKCYFCGESNEILIQMQNIGYRNRRIEEANGKVIDMCPCPACEDWMKQGVIIITIDNAKSEPDWNHPVAGAMPNPYRTGCFAVIKDEAIRRWPKSEATEFALKHRWMFMEHEAAVKIGIVKPETQK